MYYKLDYSINLQEVGHISQSSRLTGVASGGLSAEVHSYLKELQEKEDFPEEIPILKEILLEEDAKLTDYIHTTYLPYVLGILISERFKIELQQLNLTNYKFYEAKVTHKKKEYKYYFLLLKDCKSSIDYPESLFHIEKVVDSEVLYTKVFQNAEEQVQYAQKIIMELKLVTPGEIKLKEVLDIIRIPYTAQIYISEKVKKIIDTHKFSGMEIVPAKETYKI